MNGLNSVSSAKDNATEFTRHNIISNNKFNQFLKDKGNDNLKELNNKLYQRVILVSGKKASREDFELISVLIDSINAELNNAEVSSIDQSDSYYLIGVYSVLTGNTLSSIVSFNKSIEIRENLNVYDLRLGRAQYNMGIAYRKLGDSYRTIECQLKVIEIFNNIFGKNSTDLIDP